MILPLQITWRDIPPSPALEADIRQKAQKLEQFSDHILRCKVVVEAAHRHHHQGNLYRLHIAIKVPRKEIVISRDPDKDHAHEDMYVVVRDAFNAARRQVQDHVRHLQGKVKQHDEHDEARIAGLFPDDGYGFIENSLGEQIYFHRNALINRDFDLLQVGDTVRYIEEMGNQGPQAKQVSVPKKHLHTA